MAASGTTLDHLDAESLGDDPAWKEATNMSQLSFPSSAHPSEALNQIMGDNGDLPSFDPHNAQNGKGSPRDSKAGSSQPDSESGSTIAASAGSSPRRMRKPMDLPGCKVKQVFWFIGDNHPAATGFKEGRRRIEIGGAAPVSCMSCSPSAPAVFSEVEIPDSDLSTVQFSTRQQRLDWRDFLCEIVATSEVSNLFTLFDVEADPPQYARPPPSGPPLSALSRQQSGRDAAAAAAAAAAAVDSPHPQADVAPAAEDEKAPLGSGRAEHPSESCSKPQARTNADEEGGKAEVCPQEASSSPLPTSSGSKSQLPL